MKNTELNFQKTDISNDQLQEVNPLLHFMVRVSEEMDSVNS
jgi:hypothetical protein